MTTAATAPSGDDDRSLRFTLVAIAAIVVLGLIVVPLSIPDEAPPAARTAPPAKTAKQADAPAKAPAKKAPATSAPAK
jgi:hypothetical protein